MILEILEILEIDLETLGISEGEKGPGPETEIDLEIGLGLGTIGLTTPETSGEEVLPLIGGLTPTHHKIEGRIIQGKEVFLETDQEIPETISPETQRIFNLEIQETTSPGTIQETISLEKGRIISPEAILMIEVDPQTDKFLLGNQETDLQAEMSSATTAKEWGTLGQTVSSYKNL